MNLVRSTCSSLLHNHSAKTTRRLHTHDMVAPRLIAAELLKKRKEDKARAKKTNLNRADLRVIGSSCQGYSPSLLVSSEGNTYLFNCGEGTQRNCYANHIKLTNLENLFVTRLHWPSVSGAYGLSLTLQDVGLPKFTIHSTDSLSNFFKSAEYFLAFTTGIECETRDCSKTEFDDEKFRVRCIPLDRSQFNGEGQSKKKIKGSPTLLAFHCSLPDLPGALDPARCRELRVPVGPMLAQLKSGQDVRLRDGTIVKSVEVCGPMNIGMNFIVIDCPTTQDIKLVIENPDLKRLQESRLQDDQLQVDLVVHFTPEEVTEDHRYRQWMNEFHENCKHVLLVNSAFRRANFIDSYRLQYLLHEIEPKLFPKLYLPPELTSVIENERQDTGSCELPKTDDGGIETILKGQLEDQDRIIKASTLDCFNLRPHKICESVSDKMYIDAVYKTAKFDLDYEEAYSKYIAATRDVPNPQPYEPEVVFLGTGSALPSKLRNTSCILINLFVPKRATIILDCGEDSYGQIFRHYGPEGAKEILKALKMIYISHHHTDHHIGLIELLRQRKQESIDGPIQLLLPPGIDTHLNFYNETFEDLKSTYSTINTKDLRLRPQNTQPNPLVRNLCDSLGGLLKNISLVNVEHCSNACAVVMDFNIHRPGMDVFRLAYSGDARPSIDFAKIGEDCDLLIHEATFDHRELDAALEKKHSTTSEAIHQAKRMGAKFTILTHFSQRYPKIPYFTDEFDDTIGFAFDNMAARCPSQLARLPKMKDLLKVVFSKSLNEIDLKHSKTEIKQKKWKTQRFN